MYSFCDGRLTLRNCLSSPDDINMLGKIDKQYLCLVPSFVPKDLEDMFMNNLSRTIPNKNYESYRLINNNDSSKEMFYSKPNSNVVNK